MESKAISVPISCPVHTSEFIQRVDLDPYATQQVYCLECILQYDNPTRISSHLKNISDFLDIASTFYHDSKELITTTQGAPSEYENFLSTQGEKLEGLSKHIEEEKKKVEETFTKITQDILEVINEKKQSYLQVLDQQLFSLQNWYSFFEKKLRKTYPTGEDIPFLFPTKESLVSKIQKISNATQLSGFVKNIKDDLNDSSFGINMQKGLRDDMEASIRRLARRLGQVEETRPVFEADIIDLKSQLEQQVKRLLNEKLSVNNKIPATISSGGASESDCIQVQDFELIRSWLPTDAKFSPQLLYRGTHDGMNANSFHRLCDGQGPTLTIIKCQFKGNNKTSILGGYIDGSWNKSNGYISSEKAFVFSISSKVKCPVSVSKLAGYGVETQGPSFGDDLVVGFKENYVHPSSYQGTVKIVDRQTYFGGYAYFDLIEIEVYKTS